MLQTSMPAPAVAPAALRAILADLAEAGVRPTPLAVISMATDRQLTDAEVDAIVDHLAGDPVEIGA